MTNRVFCRLYYIATKSTLILPLKKSKIFDFVVVAQISCSTVAKSISNQSVLKAWILKYVVHTSRKTCLNLNTFLLLVRISLNRKIHFWYASTLLLSTIFLYFIMLQQYVVLREAILGKNRCTRDVSWMLCHYLQKEEEKWWYYSFFLKIKYLITKWW